jgi:hypothetical protein
MEEKTLENNGIQPVVDSPQTNNDVANVTPGTDLPSDVNGEQPVQEQQPTVIDGVTIIPPTEAELAQGDVVPKKKVNKTLIIVLIFVVVLGGVMLLLSSNNDGGGVFDDEDTEGKEEIKVNVGSDWGNLYLAHMINKHPEILEYEISFIDLDYNGVPEMLYKYKDKSDQENLRILYIVENDVYETRSYKNYKIKYIYSLKDKTVDWYIYLTTKKQYGTYTMLSKIINNMAFDSDIKATTDSELVAYGKKYYATDYDPVFYYIKEAKRESDFKDFVGKYETYNDKVNKLKEEIIDKYKDYKYEEEIVVTKDFVNLDGREFKFGNYYGDVQADEDKGTYERVSAITLNPNNTIIVDGTLYDYTPEVIDSNLNIDGVILVKVLASGQFSYNGVTYTYSADK